MCKHYILKYSFNSKWLHAPENDLVPIKIYGLQANDSTNTVQA